MPWPLAGREAELRSVADALSDASASGIVIAGPAGVGKTRLAVEASALAAARGCTVAWVRATRSAAGIPLALATSAIARNVELVFELTALGPHFELVLSAEHVARGKPDP